MKTNEEMIKDRDSSIIESRRVLAEDHFILDTETTGLNNAQMCQIAILRSDGASYKSYVKPTIPIEAGASNVHHITDEMVKDAPIATDILLNIPIDGIMVIYNAPFDTKVIKQSLLAHRVDYVVMNEVIDAMQLYSRFKGVWNDYYQNYKWHKLEDACRQCGIDIDLDLHDALSDVIMTERLLKYMASQELSTEQKITGG